LFFGKRQENKYTLVFEKELEQIVKVFEM
jgi:hypothetical protein